MRRLFAVYGVAVVLMVTGTERSIAGIIRLDNSPGSLGALLDEISPADLGSPVAGPLLIPGWEPLAVEVIGVGSAVAGPRVNSTGTSLGINSVGSDAADRFDAALDEQLSLLFNADLQIDALDFRHFSGGEVFEFGGVTIRNQDLADGRTDLFVFPTPLRLGMASPLTMRAVSGSIGIEAMSVQRLIPPTNPSPGNMAVPEPSTMASFALLGLGCLRKRWRVSARTWHRGGSSHRRPEDEVSRV